jgi:hypothetical protein
MMSIQNPEEINSPAELTDLITQLKSYETANQRPGAIVKMQNRSLGAAYLIVDADEAQKKLRVWEGSEIFLKYWSLSDLEKIKYLSQG